MVLSDHKGFVVNAWMHYLDFRGRMYRLGEELRPCINRLDFAGLGFVFGVSRVMRTTPCTSPCITKCRSKNIRRVGAVRLPDQGNRYSRVRPTGSKLILFPTMPGRTGSFRLASMPTKWFAYRASCLLVIASRFQSFKTGIPTPSTIPVVSGLMPATASWKALLVAACLLV